MGKVFFKYLIEWIINKVRKGWRLKGIRMSYFVSIDSVISGFF